MITSKVKFHRYAVAFEEETGRKAKYVIRYGFNNDKMKFLWIESDDNGGEGMYFVVNGPKEATNALRNILEGYHLAKNGVFGGFFKIPC